MLFEWDDETFSVGIRKMDDQHKRLVGLINALHEHRHSADKAFIERVILTLVEYTKNHFVDEERLLEKLHWNHLEAHRAQHKQFIAKLNAFRQMFEQNAVTADLVEKLTEFLKNWLTRHILVEDKSYQKYLES